MNLFKGDDYVDRLNEDCNYCGGCGRLWDYCNCLCSFCPFGGKCKTCKEVHEFSKPTNMPFRIALWHLAKTYLDLGIALLKLNLNRIKGTLMKNIRRR